MARAISYLLSSSALSNLGDGVLKVGAPLLAVGLTRSPAEVSVVGVAATLPWLLLALPAGVVADRLDRKWIMTVANAVRALLLVLLALAGPGNLWLLATAVLLAGVAEVFADTSAQSVLPMTVPADRLAWANGRVVGLQTVGNDFLGAPIAGLLAAALPAAVFGAPGLLYGAAALLLLGMRGGYRPERRESSLRGDVGEALRYLWRHRFLRNLAASAGLLNLANAAYFAVFVLWAVDTIGVPAARYGLIMTALAVGVVAGSLLSDRLAVRLGERELLVGGWLINCLLLLVPVLVPVEWPLYPTMVAMGATGGAVNVLVISTRQRLIPAGMLGRVNSVYRLIGMGGMPVGAALGGFVGELGLPIVFVGAVGVCLAAVGLIWWTTRHGISGSLTSKSILPDISRSR